MNKIIIPRKDHEVYFIHIPGDIKVKQIHHYVTEQLDKQHPAFNDTSAIDLQQFFFDEARWIMATVMDEEIFSEYKILNKGAGFFTNTSIKVNQNNFLHAGINTIDDEQIGFDAEKKLPVSIPLEPENIGAQELALLLRTIPPRHGVFNKKIPHRRIALASSALVVMLLISFTFAFTSKSATQIQAPVLHTEHIVEIKYLPFATEILAVVASDIVNAGGEMLRWHYNEGAEPIMTLQLQGVNVLAVYKIFEQYGYVFLQEIKNVSYIDGKPHVTINMNTARPNYTVHSSIMFPTQSSALPIIIKLTNAFQQSGITITSEALPVSGNSYYTITYTVNDKNLIRSLDIISEICAKYPLRVKSMDISIANDKHQFAVNAALVYFDVPIHIKPLSENDKKVIPKAFGYTIPAPPSVPEVKTIQSTNPEPPIIGSIRGGGTNITFYRDTSSGKIRIKENP